MTNVNIYQADSQRYDSMTYHPVGRSGLKFPAVSLGFWHNFGSRDCYDNMRAMARAAFDSGITQFDLANNYGPAYGSAEESLGRLMRDDFRPYRDELIITTKAGYDMWEGPYGHGGSRKYLISSLEQSLKRMNLDYVDIFYHHCMDSETPVEESLQALVDVVRQGKALYVGVSNYDEEHTRRAVQYLRDRDCPFVVNQRSYSIFNRAIEQDGVKEFCAQEGVGIIAFSPLAQGMLSDKYLKGIPADSRIARDGRFLKASALTEERLGQIAALNNIAARRGQTLAQMALSWVLRDGKVCSVLIGASKPEQIVENIAAANRTDFTAEELAEIDQACGIHL